MPRPENMRVRRMLAGLADRRLDPVPDRRIGVRQCGADADDRIFHAASMARSGSQFQGNNVAIPGAAQK
jgi:hypothetical protein